MGHTYSLLVPPARPPLTEVNLPRQDGKVFVVTGGTAGIGYELCRILYQAGGKVYLGGRSEKGAQAAISKIKALPCSSPGGLLPFHLELDDFVKIKPAVELFLKHESRLDALFNNAGVSNPPPKSMGWQGHELQMATNCLGPYLLTQLLTPILVKTAKATTLGATRVIWYSSVVTDLSAPPGGMDLAELARPSPDNNRNYTTTKTGNWFLADALAKQIGSEGVLSVCINPGNMHTQLTRHMPSWIPFLASPLLYQPSMGAYTALWAGFSPELGVEDGGKFILPWGRIHPAPREDLLAAMRSEKEGGIGIAEKFVEFCEGQMREYR